MKTKTIITTMLLLFSLTVFAQEKQLPNKEETKNYLNQIVSEAYGKKYVSNESLIDVPSFKNENLFSDKATNNRFSYNDGTKKFYCQYYGNYDSEHVIKRYFEKYDFRRLKDIELTSDLISKATALRVKLIFEDKNIDYTITYTGIQRVNCPAPDDNDKVNYVPMFIPNEEGSFDRFKKALFHYKDLLIAEQKQKIADDPFAN